MVRGARVVQAVMRAMGSDGERQVKLRPPARPPLTACCAARLLTGHGPVPVRGPEVGDHPHLPGVFQRRSKQQTLPASCERGSAAAAALSPSSSGEVWMESPLRFHLNTGTRGGGAGRTGPQTRAGPASQHTEQALASSCVSSSRKANTLSRAGEGHGLGPCFFQLLGPPLCGPCACPAPPRLLARLLPGLVPLGQLLSGG
ncbi:ras-related protein Ral-B isoform X2 [Balaenoptera ricei]|uniref:ras-related protein Ral-B isoform X2 n=1 Tax=Balaenoptera ricei TaxID=2746895 RepID=UPI0028BF4C9D|nr:ras-related protein Ral-B isoform X2 [Balaenoptera ricei]